MRNVLVLVASCLVVAACDDKSSSSGGTKSTPSAPAPSASMAVVNAKLGCIPAKEGGNAITGPAEGPIALSAAGGKAQLVVGASRVVLDGDGKPEGAMQPAADAGPGDEKLSVTVSGTPLEATVRAGGKTVTTRLDAPASGETFDAVKAVAGNTWAAVVYRATKGDTSELRAVHLGPDGKKDAATVLVKASVAAPAVAFEGDMLHVIWPERANDKAPYRLRWVKWSGKGAPSETQFLSTRGGAATEPALAVQPNGLFLVAWTDGDPGKTVVKAGASRFSLLHAVTSADDISDRSGKAHEPAVALDGRKTWVAWKDDHGLRSTTLRCIE